MDTSLIGTESEIAGLERFRKDNPSLFKKNDRDLTRHLATVFACLTLSTCFILTSPFVLLKMVGGVVSAFFIFCFINVTIHHHLTHHNAAENPFFKKILDLIYFAAVPNGPKRRSRYIRAHLNHHARPFHETDVDHHYGTEHYLVMMKTFWTKILYFLELTFVGGYMPGWEDDRYMNQVPLEAWNREDYARVKREERRKAWRIATLQWGGFALLLFLFSPAAWAWAFPMLLVKNWAHFLGQFQHYDKRLLENSRSVWNRTKSFHIPGWLNYLTGGEISGHCVHHLFPELPYYHIEEARKRLAQDSELAALFLTY